MKALISILFILSHACRFLSTLHCEKKTLITNRWKWKMHLLYQFYSTELMPHPFKFDFDFDSLSKTEGNIINTGVGASRVSFEPRPFLLFENMWAVFTQQHYLILVAAFKLLRLIRQLTFKKILGIMFCVAQTHTERARGDPIRKLTFKKGAS